MAVSLPACLSESPLRGLDLSGLRVFIGHNMDYIAGVPNLLLNMEWPADGLQSKVGGRAHTCEASASFMQKCPLVTYRRHIALQLIEHS